jgi:hypothetical protein
MSVTFASPEEEHSQAERACCNAQSGTSFADNGRSSRLLRRTVWVAFVLDRNPFKLEISLSSCAQ